MPTYNYSGAVEITIWAKRSAGWQVVNSDSAYVESTGWNDGAAKTFNWSITDRVYQLGSNVLAVGIDVTTMSGGSATLTSFTKLAWQAQGSSGGSSSATPNGEKTTVTVSP